MTRRPFRRLWAIAAALAIALTGVGLAQQSAEPAAAANGSDFQPGYIISDQLFYDSNAMTEAEIQAFLLSKRPTCVNSNCLTVVRTDTFSRPADRTVCGAYTGASGELASTIIYKVQRACGISAKVLLVTLQKEQSLVTHSGPSAFTLSRAMGYGCPDSAGGECDANFYGLYNQIYKAAWQLKRYSTPDPWGNFQPGWRNILYHPYNDCGTLSVNIQNNATAALYNYTPYVPNSAALSNLYGTGDSCSSYGNRNFWAFYSDWFGNPTGQDGSADVQRAYQESGGAGGPLGAITEPENCTMNTPRCWQRHVGGSIYWSAPGGARVVLNDYDAVYRATGGPTGPLGSPTSNRIVVNGNPNGNGGGQIFQYGTIYHSAAGVFPVWGDIHALYHQLEGNPGPVGWPISNPICSGGVCGQEFQGAILGSSPTQGAYTVDKAYLPLYRNHGGLTGPLGLPSGPRASVTAPAGPGSGQQFTTGTIYTSASGTFAVYGASRDVYWRLGSNQGTLGWPTSAVSCTDNVCEQRFQGGLVATGTNRTGRAVLGEYATLYLAYGGTKGSLGFPTGDYVQVSSPNGAGHGQAFEYGTIYGSAAGTFVVRGAIRDEYWANGGNTGALGWPVAAEVCNDSGSCTQRFQYGTLPGGAGPVGDYYRASGGASGPFGPATSQLIQVRINPNGPGSGQHFANGTIYSSDAGTFGVLGAMLSEYWRAGSNSGPLGWPIADQTCADGVCSQPFQHGTVFTNGSIGAAVPSEFVDAYVASGGPNGPLGYSMSFYLSVPKTPNGPGSGQTFSNGTIYASDAGAYAVSGATRAEYWRLGSNAGTLGWPTGPETCADGVCSQPFQHGTVFTNGSTSAAIPPAFVEAYIASGGPNGPLGSAVSFYLDVPNTPNGPGSGQTFTNGTIYSSEAGTFAVSGAIRAEYWRAGSNQGPLGWPTGPETCADGVCSQPFQHGTVFTNGSTGAAVPGVFVDAYVASGGPNGPLGYSMSFYIDVPSTPNGPGSGQTFSSGTIYSSEAGTFIVAGAFRDEYWRLGSNMGPLGWPTSDQTCTEGICTQTFQGGTITR